MTDRIVAKIAEIRHQMKCNQEIIERSHPDSKPHILPHVIVTLNGHLEDRLQELEQLLMPKADRDSVRIVKQFADMYRSGAQGASMEYDAAQMLALAIDDILESKTV